MCNGKTCDLWKCERMYKEGNTFLKAFLYELEFIDLPYIRVQTDS